MTIYNSLFLNQYKDLEEKEIQLGLNGQGWRVQSFLFTVEDFLT